MDFLYIISFILLMISFFGLFKIRFLDDLTVTGEYIKKNIKLDIKLKPKFVPLKNVYKKRNNRYFKMMKIPNEYKKYIKSGIYVLGFIFIVLVFFEKSIFMIPILYGLFMIPNFILIGMKKNKEQELLEEMSITLDCLTTAFQKCSLADAIRANLDMIKSPLREPFLSYLRLSQNSPDQYKNLEILKREIKHPLWERWVSIVQDSLYDNHQKALAFGVIDDLAEDRQTIIFREQEANKAKNEFSLCVIVSVVGLFVISMMNEEMRTAIFNTWYGNMILSASICVMIYCVHGVYSLLSNNDWMYGGDD